MDGYQRQALFDVLTSKRSELQGSLSSISDILLERKVVGDDDYSEITSHRNTPRQQFDGMLEIFMTYKGDMNIFEILVKAMESGDLKSDLSHLVPQLEERAKKCREERRQRPVSEPKQRMPTTDLLTRYKKHLEGICTNLTYKDYFPLQVCAMSVSFTSGEQAWPIEPKNKVKVISNPIDLLYNNLHRGPASTGAAHQVDFCCRKTYAIISGAGSGKSTLCEKVLCDFACSSANTNPDCMKSKFEYPIFIRCSEINGNESLEELLGLDTRKFKKSCEREAVMEYLCGQHGAKSVLLVVDGIDEIREDVFCKSKLEKLLCSDMLGGATAIMTSRLCENVKTIVRKTGAVCHSLAGFSEYAFGNYVEALGGRDTFDVFNDELSQTFKYMVMRSPLLTKLTWQLFDANGSLPRNETHLYSSLVCMWTEVWVKKKTEQKQVADADLRSRAALDKLEKVCLEHVVEKDCKFDVSEDEHLQLCRDMSILRNISETSCSVSSRELKQLATPMHLTWMEYFAACALAKCPEEAVVQRIKQIGTSSESYPLWKFLCGRLNPEYLPAVMHEFTKDTKCLSGFSGKRRRLFLMECLLENQPANDDADGAGLSYRVDAAKIVIPNDTCDLSYCSLTRLDATIVKDFLFKYSSAQLHVLMDGCQLDKGRVATLFPNADALRNISTLNLSSSSLHGDALLEIMHAVRTSNLEELHLNDCDLDYSDMSAVAQMMCIRSLRKLSLENQCIGLDGVRKLLECMGGECNLTHLFLGECSLPRGTGEWLGKVIDELADLEEIFLSGNELTSQDLQDVLCALQKNLKEKSSVKNVSIHVRYNKIVDHDDVCQQCIINFFTLLRRDFRCFLCLEGNNVSRDCLENIYDSLRQTESGWSHEHVIRIAKHWIRHGEMVNSGELCVERFCKQMEGNDHADQSRLAHDDTMLTSLADEFCSRKQQFASIDFSWNGISSLGSFSEKFLQKNDTLRVLDLRHNKIGLQCLVHLLEVIKHSRVEALEVGENDMFSSAGDGGDTTDVNNLKSYLIKCRALRYLGLRSTGMSDELGEQLVPSLLQLNAGVVIVDLSGNRLGGRTAKALMTHCTEQSKLKQISLARNCLSDADVKIFYVNKRCTFDTVWMAKNDACNLKLLKPPLYNADFRFNRGMVI